MSQFTIDGNYDLVLFFGILYHLKNPFYVLEKLSQVSGHMLLSTWIACYFRTADTDLSDVPAAYLLAPDEANNDATNFWIFTASGVRRLACRTGWDVVGFRTVGDTVHSNPRDNDRDERAFALLLGPRDRLDRSGSRLKLTSRGSGREYSFPFDLKTEARATGNRSKSLQAGSKHARSEVAGEICTRR
jgi:hypothetical protein